MLANQTRESKESSARTNQSGDSSGGKLRRPMAGMAQILVLASLVVTPALASCTSSEPRTNDESAEGASEPLTGTAITTPFSLTSNVSAGATSLPITQALTTTLAGRIWVAIDPYTTNCDVVKVTGISGQTLTTEATQYSHSNGAWVAPLETAEATVQMFGAKGNGTYDDSSAIQAAADSPIGVVLFPKGQYIVSSQILVRKAKIFRGVGTRGGGLGGNSADSYGAVIDHTYLPSTDDCAHALFYVTGENPYPSHGVGGGFENLTLRQAYGNNSSHSSSNRAGYAICYQATSAAYWSTWNHIRNVNIEILNDVGHTPAYDWTWGIYLDGGTEPQGQRDTWIENTRITSEWAALGSIKAYNAKNLYISNTLLNGSAGRDILAIDGGSPSDQSLYSAHVQLAGVSAAELSIDHAYRVGEHGGIWAKITTTTNTDRIDLHPKILVTAPTFSAARSTLWAGVYEVTGKPTTWSSKGTVFNNASSLYSQDGGPMLIGTLDTQQLRFMTSNTLRGGFDTSGDFEIWNPGSGLILKAPNASCWRLTVNNAGQLGTSSVTCPF